MKTRWVKLLVEGGVKLDREIEVFKKKYWNKIRKCKNVHGFSGIIWQREKGGKLIPGTRVIRIYVTKKESISSLSKKDIVPRVLSLGNDLIETDIVVKPRMKYMDQLEIKDDPAVHRKKFRPYLAGVSCTSIKSTACTLNWYARKVKRRTVGGLPVYQIYLMLNNHCYPGYTEVLTKDGFKRWDEINGTERFASLAPDGSLEYLQPIRFHKIYYRGPMKLVKSKVFEVSMTPGNTVYFAKAPFHSRKAGDFKLGKIEEIEERLAEGKTTTVRFKNIAKWKGVDNDMFSEELIELLGWYLSEGSACENSIGQKIVSIRQRENRYYERIYKCMKSMEARTWRCKSAIVSNNPSFHQLLKDIRLYGVHSKEKFIPTTIKELPPSKLKILLDTLRNGDGDSYGRFNTSSRRLANDVCEVALKLGIPTLIKRESRITNFSKGKESVLYRVRFLKTIDPLVSSITEYPYSGFVYDVTLPMNHTLFIREKGCGVWAGNCGSRENKAKKGELWIQPSPYDGGKESDAIAKYVYNVPTKFTSYSSLYKRILFKLYKLLFAATHFRTYQAVNHADICFGIPLDPDEISYSILGIEGRIVGKGEHKRGIEVYKSGRTTGVTSGPIEDPSWNGYVQGSRGLAYYEDVVLCRVKCAGGDSGSPVVSKDGIGNLRYHGALFAGSDEGDMLYCKWEYIEKEGRVEIVTY